MFIRLTVKQGPTYINVLHISQFYPTYHEKESRSGWKDGETVIVLAEPSSGRIYETVSETPEEVFELIHEVLDI